MEVLRFFDGSVEKMQRLRVRRTGIIDVDVSNVEANKKQAWRAYGGTRGFQPQGEWRAEQGVWVFDQLCDGSVPTAYELKQLLKQVFGRLPCSTTRKRLRADIAPYDEKALT